MKTMSTHSLVNADSRYLVLVVKQPEIVVILNYDSTSFALF